MKCVDTNIPIKPITNKLIGTTNSFGGADMLRIFCADKIVPITNIIVDANAKTREIRNCTDEDTSSLSFNVMSKRLSRFNVHSPLDVFH